MLSGPTFTKYNIFEWPGKKLLLFFTGYKWWMESPGGINKSLPQWEVVMCHLALSLAGAYKRNGRTGALVRNISKLWSSPGHCQLHPDSHVSNGETVRTGQEAHLPVPQFQYSLCLGILKEKFHWNECIFTILLVCKETSPWNLSCITVLFRSQAYL